jgi:hypothetical protein
MFTPRKELWTTFKRVFRYFSGTKDYAICNQGKLGGGSELNVHVIVDDDSVGDLDFQRSTIGYVFKMFGGKISWMSK